MIVSIGEALIDYKEGRPYVGGCPLNVALAAARCGSPVSFIGGISSDENGLNILQFIIDNCILFDPVFCNTKERTMTVNAKVSGNSMIYEFDWKGSSAFSIKKEQLETVFENNSDINCAFFGSVSFTDEQTRNTVLKFLDTKNNIVRFFDPNIRPDVINDMVSYAKVISQVASTCQIVKVSDEDLKLCNLDEQQLLSVCPDNLIVTRGNKGATWYSKHLNKYFDQDAYEVETIKDTIGCGDTFSGCILSMLDKMGKLPDLELTEDDIRNILKMSVKAAALNCTKEGCCPPTSDEINK